MSTLNANISSVIEKVEMLLQQFQQGNLPTDRFLDGNIWAQVMLRIGTWIEDTDLAMNSPYL